MEKCTECSILVRTENWSRERIEKITSQRSMRYSWMCQSQSLVNVVKRNEDDSQGDVLFQKKDQTPEEVRHIRLKESAYHLDKVITHLTGAVSFLQKWFLLFKRKP